MKSKVLFVTFLVAILLATQLGSLKAGAQTSTVLSITVPSQSWVVNATTITGKLTASGQGVAGKTVTLCEQLSNTRLWNVVGSATTGQDGGFTFSFNANASYGETFTYKAIYAGDAVYAGSGSNSRTVNYVQIPTSLTISTPLLSHAEQPFNVTGVLTAGGRGLPSATVNLYEFIGYTLDSFVFVSTTTTNASGSYAFSVSFRVGGTQLKTNYGGVRFMRLRQAQ